MSLLCWRHVLGRKKHSKFRAKTANWAVPGLRGMNKRRKQGLLILALGAFLFKIKSVAQDDISFPGKFLSITHSSGNDSYRLVITYLALLVILCFPSVYMDSNTEHSKVKNNPVASGWGRKMVGQWEERNGYLFLISLKWNSRRWVRSKTLKK